MKRIATIVATMASEFGADLEPITLCLRDASDHLVTKHNLALKVRSGEKLRSAPFLLLLAFHTPPLYPWLIIQTMPLTRN